MEFIEGAGEVFAGLALKVAKVGGEVNALQGEESTEQPGALLFVEVLGNPGVFDADGGFVLVEGCRRLPQDGEVDIDHVPGVRRGGPGGMLGGEHELMDVRYRARGKMFLELTGREGSALLFVVAGMGVVDGVVKPEGKFEFAGVVEIATDTGGLGEAKGDVVEIVIGAMRLGVERDKQIEQGFWWRRDEELPGFVPSGDKGIVIQVHLFAL